MPCGDAESERKTCREAGGDDMELHEAADIFRHFAVDADVCGCDAFGNGNINTTYRVRCTDGKSYTLQRINTVVFPDPDALMKNIVGVTGFLGEKLKKSGRDPEREALHVVPCREGGYYYTDKGGKCWRVCLFVDRATAYDAADRPGLLYEAARMFGSFQRDLNDYPAAELYEVIPDFHHTGKRYLAFEEAVRRDAAGRAEQIPQEIAALRRYASRATLITDRLEAGSIPTRVTHNDTKLNNVLIDETTGKGVCVIDLDTVMPGSLLYDFGDSVRFAANNGAEDDTDLFRIWLDLDRYREYLSGFLAGVQDSITGEERELLPMSVFILTYELALRFATDYLNGDTYFRIRYPEHNLVRTRAQIRLMEDIDGKLDRMAQIVREECGK